ncbi:unnamed protein product [Rotaria sp. Silwood1]|nr:unnamed protein product [Rotaria sp. Silwood1]CAF4691790.1 unnamed protein product [Rotaria sp. Silwood1]
MSSSVPPKGSDVANEKLREMGAGTAIGHQGGSANSDTRSVESNDRVNSSLAGGMTLGPPINVNNGYEILSDSILCLYLNDDSLPIQSINNSHNQLLYDLIYDILVRHIQTITFRERDAGFSLHSNMNDQGFNINIGIDFKTGFIFGGNRWNCGTWVNKMGSSDKAINKGHPATPCDGSSIELIALSRSILSWLIQMNKQGYFRYDSIQISSESSEKTKLCLTDWLNIIAENFEKEFWIDESNISEYVNRKQIYNDTVNSTSKWTDFQLRPNFAIASVIAPEIDYNYVGDYVCDDDLYDCEHAYGFNYHNGPEWLWLIGYYIRAKLYWLKQQNDSFIVEQTIKHVREILSLEMDLLYSNDWKRLPELTNKNGQTCSYSCSIYFCSCATILEALYDLLTI